MFDTLIELYDRNTYDNLLASMQLRPRRLIIAGGPAMDADQIRSRAGRFFALRQQKISVMTLRATEDTLESRLALLERIYEEHPHAALNLNGGADMMLVAAGCMLERSRLPMFYFDTKTGTIRDIRGCRGLVGQVRPLKLSVAQLLAVSGASIGRGSRLVTADLYEGMRSDVYRVWDIFSQNRNAWGRNTGYFQSLPNPTEKGLTVKAPQRIRIGNGAYAVANSAILDALASIGLIHSLSLRDETLTFTYKNEVVAHCLRDTGIWLELFSYFEALASCSFDDIRLCGVIDWNTGEAGAPTTSNEIDLILTRGTASYFVSCKTGSVSADTLNEIYTMAHRFGGEMPHPVIVTAHDFARLSPGLDKRARDMGISVLGGQGMREGDLCRQFIAIAEAKVQRGVVSAAMTGGRTEDKK